MRRASFCYRIISPSGVGQQLFLPQRGEFVWEVTVQLAQHPVTPQYPGACLFVSPSLIFITYTFIDEGVSPNLRFTSTTYPHITLYTRDEALAFRLHVSGSFLLCFLMFSRGFDLIIALQRS